MHIEQQRVKHLLQEAITLLCRNSLPFNDNVTVEGLLGITVDKTDILLVSINEIIQNTIHSKQHLPEHTSILTSSDTNALNIETGKLQNGTEWHKMAQSDKEQKENNISDDTKHREVHCDYSNNCNLRQNTSTSSSITKSESSHLTTYKTPSVPLQDCGHVLPGTVKDAPVNPEIKCEQMSDDEDCYLVNSDDDISHTSKTSQSGMEDFIDARWTNVIQHDFETKTVKLYTSKLHQQCDMLELNTSNSVIVPFLAESLASHQANDLKNDPHHWNKKNPEFSQMPYKNNRLAYPLNGSTYQEKSYACTLCGRAFHQSSHLYRHMRTVHMGQRLWSCDICGMKFSQSCNVKVHRLSKHPETTIGSNVVK